MQKANILSSSEMIHYRGKMLIQITEKTSTEELVRAGASPDGKIIQQAIFIQAGLNAPVSFFYDSSIVKKSGDKFVIDNRLDALVAPYADKNYEYQVRTEGSYEANRAADYFSESRTGLTAENLIENIIGVVVDSENIRQVVGLIQIVPSQNLSTGTSLPDWHKSSPKTVRIGFTLIYTADHQLTSRALAYSMRLWMYLWIC